MAQVYGIYAKLCTATRCTIRSADRLCHPTTFNLLLFLFLLLPMRIPSSFSLVVAPALLVNSVSTRVYARTRAYVHVYTVIRLYPRETCSVSLLASASLSVRAFARACEIRVYTPICKRVQRHHRPAISAVFIRATKLLCRREYTRSRIFYSSRLASDTKRPRCFPVLHAYLRLNGAFHLVELKSPVLRCVYVYVSVDVHSPSRIRSRYTHSIRVCDVTRVCSRQINSHS